MQPSHAGAVPVRSEVWFGSVNGWSNGVRTHPGQGMSQDARMLKSWCNYFQSSFQAVLFSPSVTNTFCHPDPRFADTDRAKRPVLLRGHARAYWRSNKSDDKYLLLAERKQYQQKNVSKAGKHVPCRRARSRTKNVEGHVFLKSLWFLRVTKYPLIKHCSDLEVNWTFMFTDL